MKWRLFIYFFVVFALFSAIVVVYQQSSERHYRETSLRERLDIFSSIAAINPTDSVLPGELRITIVDRSGYVCYDNTHVTGITENHLLRSEIQKAKRSGLGWSIRQSATTGTTYYYYAKRYGDRFVRVAMPHTSEQALMLRADDRFLWLVGGLFVVSMVMLWVLARNFGNSVERLKRNIESEQNERSRLKTEMTSSIAHELRTPVSAIRAYSETLMLTDLPPQKLRQFIERTNTASIRLTELLSDISILTKIEEASHLFGKESVNISELVKEVLEEQQSALQQNSIFLDNRLPDEIYVSGSRTLLYSVFRNLTENAIHHGGKWITLTIELTLTDDHFYHFALSDTGVGISGADNLDRIFERFYRVDQGRSRDDQSVGSGLGLSIVRHAVLFHGGNITASNCDGGGVRFDFSIAKSLS